MNKFKKISILCLDSDNIRRQPNLIQCHFSKRKGSSNGDEECEDSNVSGEECHSKRNRLDEDNSLRLKQSPKPEDVISGDSDEDDVFVPTSRPFHSNMHTHKAILDNHRQLRLSPPPSNNPSLLPHYRPPYTHLPVSNTPISMEQTHPMMKRLEMEARHIGGSIASTSSTSSSASPRSGSLNPQLTPPLPHSIASQAPAPSIPSPHYLPPTPPSPYLPASPFYHQHLQMLAAHRYQMLSQYAAAAAAANLPQHHSPFYAPGTNHFGFPHSPINSTMGLPLSSSATVLPHSSLTASSNPHTPSSPPLHKILNRSSPSPSMSSRVDSTTTMVTSPASNDSIISSQTSPSKYLGLSKIKNLANTDPDTTVSARNFVMH